LGALLLAAVVLADAAHESARFYDRNVPSGDSLYLSAYTGSILQYAQAKGVWAGLRLVQRQRGDFYRLNDLTTVLLSPLLPFNHTFAVYVNGVWFMAMAVCLYLLMKERVGSAGVALLLVVPFLSAAPPLASNPGGLTDFNVNLLGYTLGTAVLCCLLLSDNLSRIWPCVWAGVFLGLLALGRVFAVGPVGLAAGPWALWVLVKRGRGHRARAVWCLMALLAAFLAVSGWFLVPRLSYFYGYFTMDYGAPSAKGRASLADGLRVWGHLVAQTWLPSSRYLALVSFFAASALWEVSPRLRARAGALWKDVSWSYVWFGVAPILTMLLLKSNHKPYGWPATFGLWLFLIFPWRSQEEDAARLQKRSVVLALLVASALAVSGFFRIMAENHRDVTAPRKPIRRIASAILDDSKREGKTEVTLGLSHHIFTELGSLTSVLMFDRKCVVYGMFENGLEGTVEAPCQVPSPGTRRSTRTGC
jgi:hypothetical protein